MHKDSLCFNKHNTTKDNLDSRCKECRHKIYLENRLSILDRSAKFYCKNKGNILSARKQRYYLNRKQELERRDQWSKRNPFKTRFNAKIGARKRRAIKRNLQENYKDELLTKIIFVNLCANCYSNKNLEIDHHYPLSKGFELTVNNAVLLCKTCNTSKGSKRPEDFYSKDKLNQIEWILCKL